MTISFVRMYSECSLYLDCIAYDRWKVRRRSRYTVVRRNTSASINISLVIIYLMSRPAAPLVAL